MMNKRIVFFLIGVTYSLSANNDFFISKKDGYFYYKDPIIIKEEKDTKKKQENPSKIVNTTDYNSTMTKMNIPFENEEQRTERRQKEKEYMENIPWHDLDNLSADEYRRLLDTTREISVATPSKEYVKSYAALQKFWVDKSEMFAKVWSVANLENPDELIYPEIETSANARKIRYKQKTDEKKEFFSKIKNRLGFIAIIEDKRNVEEYKRFEAMYDLIKQETGVEYLIYDYYEVPMLIRKLNLNPKSLPENFLMYRGANNIDIYKRVAKGYSSAAQIIDTTKFIFENAILEKEKHPDDRAEN